MNLLTFVPAMSLWFSLLLVFGTSPRIHSVTLLNGKSEILGITPELEHRKSGYVERKRRPYQGNVV
ncbi:MAG: hypothetical protein K1W21_03695, partial [Oscillospiraceae bacterium]